jgi:hypothetical protein
MAMLAGWQVTLVAQCSGGYRLLLPKALIAKGFGWLVALTAKDSFG